MKLFPLLEEEDFLGVIPKRAVVQLHKFTTGFGLHLHLEEKHRKGKSRQHLAEIADIQHRLYKGVTS